MISIIDYGAGNLHSVKKAFEYLGFDTDIVEDSACLAHATHIVLPGVGAFANAMKSLRKNKMDIAILDAIEAGKNFLGICLGMQLLFEYSLEGGEKNEGLGLFPGQIVKFSENVVIPHMGWNSIEGKDNIIFGENSENEYVYFVHSFNCPLTEEMRPHTAAVCRYAAPFVAAVRKENCIATQFHPEKSGLIGLDILKRFGGMPVC